jgi:hypothetical protein
MTLLTWIGIFVAIIFGGMAFMFVLGVFWFGFSIIKTLLEANEKDWDWDWEEEDE